MKYRIRAEYMALQELEVEVADDLDPMDPANWDTIDDEQQIDFNLWDVLNAEPMEEDE